MYNYQTPPPYRGYTDKAQLVATTSSVMKRVYLKMTLGLLVTAFISLFCAGSHSYISFMTSNTWFFWGLFIAEIVLVMVISGGINKLSSTVATLLFFVFAAVNGLALAPIFLVYTMTSIAKTFFICAGTFGAMSIYGYFL